MTTPGSKLLPFAPLNSDEITEGGLYYNNSNLLVAYDIVYKCTAFFQECPNVLIFYRNSAPVTGIARDYVSAI